MKKPKKGHQARQKRNMRNAERKLADEKKNKRRTRIAKYSGKRKP